MLAYRCNEADSSDHPAASQASIAPESAGLRLSCRVRAGSDGMLRGLGGGSLQWASADCPSSSDDDDDDDPSDIPLTCALRDKGPSFEVVSEAPRSSEGRGLQTAMRLSTEEDGCRSSIGGTFGEGLAMRGKTPEAAADAAGEW